jgi:hypothetical protein
MGNDKFVLEQRVNKLELYINLNLNSNSSNCFSEFVAPSLHQYKIAQENSPSNHQKIDFHKTILFYNLELCCIENNSELSGLPSICNSDHVIV